MNNLLAQANVPLGEIGKGEGFGFLNFEKVIGGDGLDAINSIAKVVSTTIGLITIVAGIYLLFQLIIAAISWMTASGDKGKLEKAQLQITQAITGIIIIVAAYAIVAIIGTVLGLDILLNDPENLRNQLQLGGGA